MEFNMKHITEEPSTLAPIEDGTQCLLPRSENWRNKVIASLNHQVPAPEASGIRFSASDWSLAEAPAALLSIIAQDSPALGRLIKTHGHQSLAQYSSSWYARNTGLSENFRSAIDIVASRYHPPEVVEQLQQYFKHHTTVDTAQHLQFISGAMNLTANLAQGIQAKRDGQEVFPVFACSNVRVDNETKPAGFEFGANFYRCISEKRSEAMLASVSVESMISSLKKHNVPPLFLEAVKTTEEALVKNTKSRSLASWVTRLNYELWQKIPWREYLSDGVASPVFLPQEEVLCEFLKLELRAGHGAVYDLFDSAERLQKFVDVTAPQSGANIPGAASHVFWALNEKGKQIKLSYVSETQSLENSGVRWGNDGQALQVKLSPQKLLMALDRNEPTLMPTLPLDFYLMLGQGIHCLGGYSQIGYLPQVKDALRPLFVNSGELAGRFEDTQTSTLVRAPILSLVDHQKWGGGVYPIDFISTLCQHEATVPVLLESFRKTSLSDALCLAAPEIFRGSISARERQQLSLISKLGYAEIAEGVEMKPIILARPAAASRADIFEEERYFPGSLGREW